ncbi:MAG: D-glycero-beta-D-manno-heptose 1-phosphate adenylyltransferase [Candidatus Omnitrophica bacterium]|nr:D-glycero-beta-D-manno-heptose 1-phosphate adenylyltransferase [Candidatus Omnitrophota bacterium]MBU4487775.1 D-glycero-beta-D-manno-heptose 1-phosphate adenylyltransferase [Candidatus Omnitrophota bacterium]MCG2705185.1 D-glycero-beta-D-manno-heptose 1-phosphate adenylyltransferase [Candidatus Omnitrophota bacterium]
MTPKNRIKSLPKLIRALKPLKKKGRKIVFTNGCFDILHKGHVRLLEKAKSLGDVLIVALNTDASVKKIKGQKRPVTKQNDRALIIAALRPVDFVTFFNETTPEKAIKRISPDILVKGGDWKKCMVVGAGHVMSKGGKVYSVDFVKGYSTSGLLRKIKRSQ